MALANPGKDVNPLEGSGVVLIDELDLHMHTSWQRKVPTLFFYRRLVSDTLISAHYFHTNDLQNSICIIVPASAY